MTENEAIKELQDNIDSPFGRYVPIEVCEVAIKSLEEIQQYRAIGTVEGYEKAIQATTEYYLLMKEYKSKVQDFEAIGTIEEFKALKEKNTPMELAEHNFQDEVHHYLCPSCRNIVSCNQNYCEECGQALEI